MFRIQVSTAPVYSADVALLLGSHRKQQKVFIAPATAHVEDTDGDAY